MPNSTSASDVPLVCPGYQASTTDATWLSHGIAIGAPASATTTVCGLAAATAEISSFWAEGRSRLSRSVASDSVSSETTTTAVEADLAAATAASMPGFRAEGVPQLRLLDCPPPLVASVYRWPATRSTATENVLCGGVPGSSISCCPFRDRYSDE